MNIKHSQGVEHSTLKTFSGIEKGGSFGRVIYVLQIFFLLVFFLSRSIFKGHFTLAYKDSVFLGGGGGGRWICNVRVNLNYKIAQKTF